MERVSSSWNLPRRARNQHQEALSPSHRIAAHRHLPIRNESLHSDPYQGRVPPYFSDERLDLSRSTALPSARLQEGLGLWHGSRSHLVTPCINSQPFPHVIHSHQRQRHQQHQHPHLVTHRHHALQNRDSMSIKLPLAPNSFPVNSSAENTLPYRPLPFRPSLAFNLPSYSTTEETMDPRSSATNTNSPPTPLSSPRDGARTAAGRESAAPVSERNVAAFFARFPPQSALVLTQPSAASVGAGGTSMPAYFSAPHPLLQNRAAEPPSSSPSSSRLAPLGHHGHHEPASEPADFYAYCLDRGNGMFTRLIPADSLPMMTNVPPLLASSYGMKVLPDPPLQTQPPTMPMHLARAGSHMFPAASRYPTYTGSAPASSAFGQSFGQSFGHRPGKKNKVYCSKWVHDGTCAFTQQGCKYKHEMPHDTKTQHDLGLFQGYPAWYKKWQLEQEQKQLREPAAPAPAPSTHGAHGMPPPLPSAHGQPATPTMMRARDLDLASQPTPPFSEKSKGHAGRFGGGSGSGSGSGGGGRTGTPQTPQTAPWPSADQLADSFGRSLQLSDTSYAESQSQQARQAQQAQQAQQIQQAQQAQAAQAAHLLAQHQYRQQSSSIINTPSSLPSAADPAYLRSPSQTAGFYFGTAQGPAASPPSRDPGCRESDDNTAEYSAFGPICPPSSTMAFSSTTAFHPVASLGSVFDQQRGPGTGNPFEPFESFEPFGSQGSSAGFGHSNSRS